MKNRRTIMRIVLPLLLCAAALLTNAWAGGKITQDTAVSELSRRLATLQNRYDVVKYQWYDIYADGLVPGADEGGKLLIDARAALSSGTTQQAAKLLDAAEKLLISLAQERALEKALSPMSQMLCLASGDRAMPRRIWEAVSAAKAPGADALAPALADGAFRLGAFPAPMDNRGVRVKDYLPACLLGGSSTQ